MRGGSKLRSIPEMEPGGAIGTTGGIERIVLADPDAGIRLVPFTGDDAGDMDRLADEPGVYENTYIPAQRGPDFASGWVAMYLAGWKDGTRAGFTIRRMGDDGFLGFASLPTIDLDKLEAEAGYVVAEKARQRGIATAALRLISRWGIDSLGLMRIYLHIDPANLGSRRVAERCGYAYEGTLRSVYFKEGRRVDTALYSLLPSDARYGTP